MDSKDVCFKEYPEWYKLEKETEKTINKLSRSKELKFYLKSPDEYIRRLGILRVNALKLKESIDFLEEILDDPSESLFNKELAAWSIKSICLKWDIELFESNKLIYKFSGNEKYHEIHEIIIEDSYSSGEFIFSTSPLTSKLGLKDHDIHLNRDISLETYFSFREWIQACYSEFMMTGKQQVINLPLTIFSILKNFIKQNFKTLFNKIKNINITSLFKRNIPRRRETNNNRRRQKTSQGISLVISASNQIFRILAFPLRLIMRHKGCTLAVLIAVYCLLTFTDMGILFTKHHFGVSIIEIQKKFLNAGLMETQNEIAEGVKKIMGIAWYQFKDIADWMFNQWIDEIKK